MASLIAGPAATSDLSAQARPDMGHKPKRHHLSARMRRKTATVHVGGKAKYPIGDKAHAQAALARLNQAKPPLTPKQKAHVRKRAYTMMGKRY